MRKLISRHFNFINNVLAKRYKSLVISMIAMIILPGLLEGYSYQSLLAFMLNSLTIFLAIYAVQESKKQLWIGFLMAFGVIMVNQLGLFKSVASLDFYVSFVIYLIFYTYVAYRLLKMIIVTDNVRIGVLYAAVAVYLLLGIIGGYLFMLIENAVPGSLNNLQAENFKDPSQFMYFSFITLSTLGYGDITPDSPPARSICMILSTAGPLYLTVLVALLVSRFEHSDIH
jgi:voltage-gated potassium channel